MDAVLLPHGTHAGKEADGRAPLPARALHGRTRLYATREGMMTDTPSSTSTPSTPPGAGPMRVAVTGASGLIGQAVVRRLRAEGHTVARLVRDRGKAQPGDVAWDPEAETIDAAA